MCYDSFDLPAVNSNSIQTVKQTEPNILKRNVYKLIKFDEIESHWNEPAAAANKIIFNDWQRKVQQNIRLKMTCDTYTEIVLNSTKWIYIRISNS